MPNFGHSNNLNSRENSVLYLAVSCKKFFEKLLNLHLDPDIQDQKCNLLGRGSTFQKDQFLSQGAEGHVNVNLMFFFCFVFLRKSYLAHCCTGVSVLTTYCCTVFLAIWIYLLCKVAFSVFLNFFLFFCGH